MSKTLTGQNTYDRPKNKNIFFLPRTGIQTTGFDRNSARFFQMVSGAGPQGTFPGNFADQGSYRSRNGTAFSGLQVRPPEIHRRADQRKRPDLRSGVARQFESN